MLRRQIDEYRPSPKGRSVPNDLKHLDRQSATLGEGFRQAECEMCGSVTNGLSSMDSPDDPIVCSVECRRRWRNRSKWQSQRDYGVEWEDIREEVIEEAGEKCEFCGISRGVCKRKYGCDLHVHHVKALREHRSTEVAHRKGNLEAVCPSCHPKVE